MAHHPFRASVACGDVGGSVYLVDLVGITMGPLVVTAVDLGDGPAVRCPVCRERHPLQEAWLGRELDCPGSACTARWRVNPFVVRRSHRRATFLDPKVVAQVGHLTQGGHDAQQTR